MGIGAAVLGGAALYSAHENSKASKRAARTQSNATQQGIAEQKRQYNQTRKDLAPYRQAGNRAINSVSDLINNPEAQKNYVLNNPFYNALAGQAQDRIFNNAAAKGKLGSGGTAEALQNSLLLLGDNLLNQHITQNMNLANTGESAAAQTATAGQQVANNITDLTTSGAQARAAGTIGAANARTGALQNIVNTGTTLYGYNQMSKALG